MRAGQGILLISTTLLMLGIIMVNSASMHVSSKSLTIFELLISKPTILGLLACIALFAGSLFPLNWLKKQVLSISIPIWSLIVALALLLSVYIPGIGHEVNGANRWIAIGSFSFQPSEIAKWTVVISIAW